jgi:hypothetical protein
MTFLDWLFPPREVSACCGARLNYGDDHLHYWTNTVCSKCGEIPHAKKNPKKKRT